MPPFALLLLLAAALVHAGWNLLVKQAREKDVFLWWAWLAGSLAGAALLHPGGYSPISWFPEVFR